MVLIRYIMHLYYKDFTTFCFAPYATFSMLSTLTKLRLFGENM